MSLSEKIMSMNVATMKINSSTTAVMMVILVAALQLNRNDAPAHASAMLGMVKQRENAMHARLNMVETKVIEQTDILWTNGSRSTTLWKQVDAISAAKKNKKKPVDTNAPTVPISPKKPMMHLPRMENAFSMEFF